VPRSDGRIGCVLVAHPSPELYGSDRVLLETVKGLSDEGIRVVVTLPSTGPLVNEIRAHGGVVRLCPTPIARKSALRPAGALRLLTDLVRGVPAGLALLRRVKPDVVFVNTLTIPLWVVLGRLTGRRVVCHVHEGERSAPALLRAVLAAPLLLADQLAVNSRFSLDVLADSWPSLRRKASVVYNAIVAPARDELQAPIRLLYLGRLSPRKGPAVAVAALSLLLDRDCDARLDLVGSIFPGYEWFAAELTAQVAADPRLADRVSFHGFVSDVWPYVGDSDIVLVPSRFDEPFGNTAVEAVVAARPVVVSATSGLLEAAGGYDSVVSVEPDSAAALADAVCTIRDDWPRYRKVALGDAARARERHAPERYRADMVRLILTVAADPSP
jgi:glycosyltransferase involved in cell wall biosynthesis